MIELVFASALLLGLAAGVLSGMFGVGGGVLFVPTLALVLDLSQLSAQATSLAAMIPVVVVGTWRQHHYGHVRWRSALLTGAASVVGVAGGVVLADALGDDALRRLFAVLLVVVAAQLLWSARGKAA